MVLDGVVNDPISDFGIAKKPLSMTVKSFMFVIGLCSGSRVVLPTAIVFDFTANSTSWTTNLSGDFSLGQPCFKADEYRFSVN